MASVSWSRAPTKHLVHARHKQARRGKPVQQHCCQPAVQRAAIRHAAGCCCVLTERADAVLGHIHAGGVPRVGGGDEAGRDAQAVRLADRVLCGVAPAGAGGRGASACANAGRALLAGWCAGRRLSCRRRDAAISALWQLERQRSIQAAAGSAGRGAGWAAGAEGRQLWRPHLKSLRPSPSSASSGALPQPFWQHSEKETNSLSAASQARPPRWRSFIGGPARRPGVLPCCRAGVQACRGGHAANAAAPARLMLHSGPGILGHAEFGLQSSASLQRQSVAACWQPLTGKVAGGEGVAHEERVAVGLLIAAGPSQHHCWRLHSWLLGRWLLRRWLLGRWLLGCWA